MQDPLRFNDPEPNSRAPSRAARAGSNGEALVAAVYTQPVRFPPRFQKISELRPEVAKAYRQLSERDTGQRLCQDLLECLAPDVRNWVCSMASAWQTYGISTTLVEVEPTARFQTLFDEMMAANAVKKPDYNKLDFAAAGVRTRVTDERFLTSKLSALNLFMAGIQLGEVPALSSVRFMHNPAWKTDGKYREWIYHFDNSNFAPEYKQIVTRKAGTVSANTQQCLAAFPYDTTETIRYTREEAATKFPDLNTLVEEFRGVPGACYIVVRNPGGDVPVMTGIRTEAIPHHRSASGEEESESRDAELITYHGTHRCSPFLLPQELEDSPGLSGLQRFILGGFADFPEPSHAEVFVAFMKESAQELNAAFRSGRTRGFHLSLDALTIATFESGQVKVTDRVPFHQQVETYEALPTVAEQLPRLTESPAEQAPDRLLTLIPMLANYDQNSSLREDNSENRAFPARTEIRERPPRQMLAPIEDDLHEVRFLGMPAELLEPARLISITRDIHAAYARLSETSPDDRLLASRAALAEEYITQLQRRTDSVETHLSIVLFLYYLARELPTEERPVPGHTALLQHLVSLRMIVESSE